MNIPSKEVQLHVFSEGMDSDNAPEIFSPNRMRYALNVRSTVNGEKGIITNIMGNVLINTPLPAGVNIPLGYGSDEENGVFYFIVYNDQGKHTVFMYTELTNTVSVVLQSITDSNGEDILTLSRDFLINHVDIIRSNNGPLLTWVDGLNKAVKFNIRKALDKSDNGYGAVIYKDYVNAYKKTAIQAPAVAYTTDISKQSNFLYGKLFKFSTRFIYDDGEYSNWSDFSLVPLPPNQSYAGVNNITYDNNCITVQVETGNPLVEKIQVAMKTGTLDFVIVAILDKSELNIGSNSTYQYKFYNDKSGLETPQDKVNRQYSFLPDRPYTQAFVKNALTYSRFKEGFERVPLDVSVAVSYEDLYVPDGTVSSLNHPQFTFQLITNGYDGALVNRRYNAKWKFTIGFDVKKGNVFTYRGSDGTPPPKGYLFNFSVTAEAQDTAITIANKIIAQLRSIGRGYPNPTDCISDYQVDGSGNVSFNYQILGNVGRSPISWSGNVTPVNYVSLKDDGNSINLIKPGSSRTYAWAYEDEDGRKSLAYTNEKCQVYSDFITQTGDLKRAVHTLTINHKPPVWAKYYYLLRTPDSGAWIQFLIQKVINVDPDPSQAVVGNNQKYLDLVVGSLFTYQKLHPNTVIKYDFAKGNRLRLIKYFAQDTTLKFLYPFIETEVLSYNINTEEVVNQNISLNGSDIVTINGPANASYVGKTLIVNGYQRTIIGTPAGNQYQLNSTSPEGTQQSPVTYPTFTIKDTRGILRIKQPDGVEVKDLSLVEIYKPVFLSEDGATQQFYPFGLKLEILNYGTEDRAHAGTIQNQTGTQPAIIQVTDGDAYERNRELPTNDVVPGTQLIVDHIIDSNRSDFYESDLTNLGRVFPQDDGSGVKFFGSRTRWSNNFIEDTKVNGLNDFDNLDRKDYNDPYGDIELTKFRENRLYVFKALKTAWASVLQQRIEAADGTGLLAGSTKLLSDLQYYAWQGGIGNNPESYVSNGNYQYFASANSGVFLRLAGDGCDPISTIYNYDKESRRILSAAAKQKLRIFGGFDRENSEVIWAIPAYNDYVFNGGFVGNQWNTLNDQVPNGTTFQITQQPANSTVVMNPDGTFTLTSGTVYGTDFFVYRGQLPNGSYLPARRFCFTVTEPLNRQSVFRTKANSSYCVVRNHGFRAKQASVYCQVRNTGYRGKSSSQYCVTRPIGFRAKTSSVYCLQTASIPLADFDFMVLRYLWDSGAGFDLDSFTGLTGTSSPYNGNPTTRQNWVGYGQNTNAGTGAADAGSRKIPYGSSTPYLYWGADNTSSPGVEAILVDIKKFQQDYPATPNPISLQMNAVWYGQRLSGNITVEITTYKGGTMSLDEPNRNFVNTGGVVVNSNNIPYNVSLNNQAYLITSSQAVARMDFDKTTNTASLTIL